VAGVAHLGRPSGPASNQLVKRPRLALEWQHDVNASAGSQDSRHFAKYLLWISDVFQHVEDPDEVELGIQEGQPLGGGWAKVNALRNCICDRKSGLAQVTSKHIQILSLPLHCFGYRAGATAYIQDFASYVAQVR
jgi:hypothetical protein